MKEQVIQTINRHNMISDGDRVLVAVSGGADSMCLLDILNNLKDILNINVGAAHVNHCIRGKEADRDEQFVREYCTKKNISFHPVKIDIPAIAERTGESTELCARRERYAFFDTLEYDKIATAHTGTDAVETLIMNLSRGSSLKGLCSIPAVRGNIIRPLIELTRNDTESYCADKGIEFVTDSSNLTDDYTRNKFRHNVIPVIKSINPAFEKNTLRCIESLNRDERFISEYSEKVFHEILTSDNKLDIRKLRQYNECIQWRVVALFFSLMTDSDYENIHIKNVLKNADCHFAVTLPGDVCFEVNDGYLKFVPKKCDIEKPDEITINKNMEGSLKFGDYIIEIKHGELNYPTEDEQIVDFLKIDDIISIRTRLPGDNIGLPGRKCTKTLKKYFNEIGMPVEDRAKIPVFSDRQGIIAIGGVTVDSSRIPDKKTKSLLIIKTEGGKNE